MIDLNERQNNIHSTNKMSYERATRWMLPNKDENAKPRRRSSSLHSYDQFFLERANVWGENVRAITSSPLQQPTKAKAKPKPKASAIVIKPQYGAAHPQRSIQSQVSFTSHVHSSSEPDLKDHEDRNRWRKSRPQRKAIIQRRKEKEKEKEKGQQQQQQDKNKKKDKKKKEEEVEIEVEIEVE
ncbi:hypothetical protein RFI_31923, partial [Reticulomyxa filosa]